MNNWLRQHRLALASAFAHIRTSPGNFLFNVLVVAIALSLPIAGLTLIENLRPVTSQLSIDPELSVFMNTSAAPEDSAALQKPIAQLLSAAKLRASVRFIPKDKALAAMEQNSHLAEVLATLGGNPLPDAYVITLSKAKSAQVDALATQLQGLPEVDVVQVDSAWIKRLAALMQILQVALLALAFTLSVVVLVVVFNATRLQVLSHREEIAISRLYGATNSFIHRPYYYAGAMLGLLAGGLALGLVALGLYPLNQAITEFAKLYASEFHLAPLNASSSALLIAASILLGWFGVFLSVRRQLARVSS
jgi:cell division transport system permease protein